MRLLKNCTTVTFGVIAFNEQAYISDLLNDLLAQTYPKELIEVILVDGNSTDDTKKIMLDFQSVYLSNYHSIKVLDNPKRIQPVGWNIVIAHSTADVILRIDAHAKLPNDFIKTNMKCINSGEFVCGGPRINIIDEDTPWKKMLLDSEQAMFGSGFASYRQDTQEKKYVSSVFHGAYRKEVFERAGLFNEKLVRTEDNEIHYRIRNAGYQICYSPEIKSYYQTRNSLEKLLKQKYQNGFWVGKTLFVSPKCLSVFHFVPFLFVIFSIMAVILAITGLWEMLAFLASLYFLFLSVTTVVCLVKNKNITDLLLPFVIFFIHISYGIGTMIGIINDIKSKSSENTTEG